MPYSAQVDCFSIFKFNCLSRDQRGQRKLSSKEKREYENLEKKIAQLETEKAEAENELYNSPPTEVSEVQKLHEKVEGLGQEIDIATERWLELAEIDS